MDTLSRVYPEYKGKPIIPSKHVQRELDDSDMNLWDVKQVLAFGYDCSRSRRKENILERCVERDNKVLRVVVALVEWEEDAFWRLIHVGKSNR